MIYLSGPEPDLDKVGVKRYKGGLQPDLNEGELELHGWPEARFRRGGLETCGWPQARFRRGGGC